MIRATVMSLALLIAATAGAATSPALQCVQTQRDTQKACLDRTKSECNTVFQAAVPPCFGTNAACAEGCMAGQSDCSSSPDRAREGCRAACAANQQAAAANCNSRKCSLGAKLKGLKCKQKCERNVVAALAACSSALSECLKSCAAAQ
jgi:hypothetical protein